MKKFLVIVIFVLAAAFVTVAGSFIFFLRGQSFNNFSRRLTRPILAAIFQREVEFDRLEPGLTKLTFYNVAIASQKALREGQIIRAPEVVIKFNPINLLLHRGDVLKSISEIIARQPEVNLLHDVKDHWNILELIPLGPAGKIPKIKITIKDGTLNFLDDHGFWDRPAEPFTARIVNFFGEANFKDPEFFRYAAFGNLQENQSLKPVKSAGYIKWSDISYKIKLVTPPLDIGRWYSYVLKIPGLELKSGAAALSLEFASIKQPAAQSLPLSINGWIACKDIQLVLNNDFQLSRLGGQLEFSDQNLKLKNIRGNIDNINILVDGRIQSLARPVFDLAVSSEKIPEKDFTQFFPALKNWPGISGLFDYYVNISGPAERLQAQGLLYCPHGRIDRLGDYDDLNISFKHNFYTGQLDYNFKDLEIFQGRLSSKGWINLNQPQPEYQSTFNLKKISLADQPLIPGANGQLSGSGTIDGKSGQNKLNMEATFSEGSRAYDQPLESFQIQARFSDDNIDLDNFNIKFREKSWLQASGNGRLQGPFALNVEGRNIDFEKPDAGGFSNRVTLYFSTSIKGQLREDIFRDPRGLSFNTRMKFRNARFFGQPVSYGELNFQTLGGHLDISSLYFREKSSELKASGTVEWGGPVDLDVSSRNLSLEDINILALYLPEKFKKISGSAAMKMRLTGFLPAEYPKLLSPEIFNTLNLVGQINLGDARIGGQSLDGAALDFAWGNGQALFNNLMLFYKNSSLKLKGLINRTGQLDFVSGGSIKLADFDYLVKGLLPWLKKYDQISGDLIYSGNFKGAWDNPAFKGSLKGQQIKLNQIVVENFDAPDLVVENRVFYFGQPLVSRKKTETYQMSGRLDFNPFLNGLNNNKIVAPQADINFTVSSGQLATIFALGEDIYNEVAARLERPGSPLTNINSIFPPADWPTARPDGSLFQNNSGQVSGILNYYMKFLATLPKTKKFFRPHFFKDVSGQIDGKINIKGDLVQPAGSVFFTGRNIHFPGGSWEQLTFEGHLEDQNRQDNIFNPSLQAGFEIKSARLGEANFSNISGNFNYFNLQFNPIKIDFLSASHRIGISGVMPFPLDNNSGSNNTIDLNLVVDKSHQRIAGPIFKGWDWLGGEGQANLWFRGTPDRVGIDGTINIKGVSLKYQPEKGRADFIRELNADILIKDSLADLKKFKFKFSGQSSKSKTNELDLSGKIDFSRIFDSHPSLFIDDLKLADCDLILDLPLWYSGDLQVKGLVLKGRLPLSKISDSHTIINIGPLKDLPGESGITNYNNLPLILAGNVYLSDGGLVIPEGGQATNIPDLQMAINIQVGPHVSLVAAPLLVTGRRDLTGLFTKGFLTGVDLGLEKTDSPIPIRGSLNDLRFEKKIILSEGGFSFLGRPFVLIKPIRQRLYFAQDLSKTGENQLEFKVGNYTGSDGQIKTGLRLALHLVGETEIIRDEPGPGRNKQKRKVLAIIDGPVGGLNIVFEEYRAGTGGPFELVARYTMEDSLTIIKLLMPQLLTALGGTGDKSAALAEFSSQQIQSIFQGTLRPVEEQIESSAGLDEVLFEYDLGDKLASSLFNSNSANVKRRVGISLAKSLFLNNLYLKLKYAQDFRNFNRLQGSLITYQIVYWLNYNYSLNYSREIDELNQNLLYNDTFTLGANYQF